MAWGKNGTPDTIVSATPPAPDFTEDYQSSAGWVPSGTTITINSGIAGKCSAINTNSTGTDQQSKALGLTLSDTKWSAEFEIMQDASGGCCDRFNVFCITAGTGHVGTASQDAIIVGLDNNQLEIYLKYKDGASPTSEIATGINLTLGVQYYGRLTRVNATTTRVEIYTDSGRTNLFGSDTQTIPATVVGLNTLCHSSANNAFGLLISYNIDNTSVYDNFDFNAVSGSMTIPDLTGKVFNVFLTHSLDAGQGITARTRYNDSSGNLYANNRATNGLANQTIGNQPDLYYGTNLNVETTYFTIAYLMAVPNQNKLQISWCVTTRVQGSVTPPERVEFTGKYIPSPDATIDREDENSSLGSYDEKSNISALGTD